MATNKRVIIVDDHSVVRELLNFRLTQITERKYEVVGESGTGQGAIDVCLQARPDILMIDLILPGLSGCEVMRRLKVVLPNLSVLVFSGATKVQTITEALHLGVAGFVSKLRPWESVLDALNFVADGRRYVDPAVAHLVNFPSADFPGERLTPREREVMQMIAESHTTKEIAGLMGVSVKTADKHRTKMMEKLKLHDAAAVTRFAMGAGFISTD